MLIAALVAVGCNTSTPTPPPTPPLADAGVDGGIVCNSDKYITLTACGNSCSDLKNDPLNCGACGNKCAIGGSCCSGTCQQSDGKNCGGCGNACPADHPNCSVNLSIGQATCVDVKGCAVWETFCGSACVNANADRGNCGACGKTCPDSQICSGGACQACWPGTTYCSGECVSTLFDTRNCGGCGNVCADGLACVNGACATGTPTPPKPGF